jgi:putative phage-type endonuclease
MIQGDAEWLAVRCGAFTASRMADLMAKTKSGPSTSRANMIATLAIERLTGQPVETYTNAAMQRGTEMEQEARDAYAFLREVTVESVAYVKHPTLPNVGCSPDGLIADDGLLEIKCPAAMAKHLYALRSGDHAREYRWQLQHQLFVTGRAWVDATSYDPRYPQNLQLAIVRVLPDEDDFMSLELEIAKAEREVSALVDELRQRTI